MVGRGEGEPRNPIVITPISPVQFFKIKLVNSHWKTRVLNENESQLFIEFCLNLIRVLIILKF